MRSRAERVQLVERLRVLCFKQGHSVKNASQIIGVDERTGYRYAREIEGGERKPNRYAELRPLILAHLSRYPTSWFSRSELIRVLPTPGLGSESLTATLRRMKDDGEVRSRRTLREDQHVAPQWVTRWSLAREDQ
ncbi:hypothetical protein [Streptosporangium sp. NPDC001681]|uniref:hypothetical protein n=1 Tax=Streptosporangium sp. NPDC001681 TaxID=3154395 RepID=UPI00332A03E9